MGAARAHALARRGAIAIGIDEVGIGGAQAGVIDHVAGIVIAIGPVIGGAIEIIGESQPVERVVSVAPRAGRVSCRNPGRRGNRGDHATGIAGIALVHQLGGAVERPHPVEPAARGVVDEGG